MLIEDRTFVLFVGSDNSTGYLSTEFDSVLDKVLDANGVEGFTINLGEGSWKGKREESAQVTIVTNEGTARRVASELRDILNQDAVALLDAGPALVFV
jgi:hypothetical protein